MIGEFIPESHTYWDFFLDLRRIADVIFSQTWSEGLSAYLRDLYQAHLHRFRELFPTLLYDSDLNIILLCITLHLP